MKTRAAVLNEVGKPMDIEELTLDGPREREVLIRYTHAGLCHSEVHLLDGSSPARLPMVMGHEGAGVVEEVGPGVDRVRPGDHVVCSFIPVCGVCKFCSTGRQSICDAGVDAMNGCLPGERWPLQGSRGSYGAMCSLGTFSQYGVVHQNSLVRIDEDISLQAASLLSCGVGTGWGSAVNAAELRPGDVAVVIGVGGIGINAVQGAVHAGAEIVVAVDPLANKREAALALGATHAYATAEEAEAEVRELTRGHLADAAILAVGQMSKEVVRQGFDIVGKGGTIVVTGMTRWDVDTVQLPGTLLSSYRKTVRGTLFGDCNPMTDIPMMLRLYRAGKLELDGLITRTYSLDEVNQGYDDLAAGKNVRGVLVLDH